MMFALNDVCIPESWIHYSVIFPGEWVILPRDSTIFLGEVITASYFCILVRLPTRCTSSAQREVYSHIAQRQVYTDDSRGHTLLTYSNGRGRYILTRGSHMVIAGRRKYMITAACRGGYIVTVYRYMKWIRMFDKGWIRAALPLRLPSTGSYTHIWSIRDSALYDFV